MTESFKPLSPQRQAHAEGVIWDDLAGVVRWIQSGYLYTYAFAMILGLVALLGGLWWVTKM